MGGMLAFGFVAALAMLFTLWCWLFLIPVYVIMRLIIKSDDRAFDIWFLWFETRWRNRNTFLGPINKKFWGASSYAPARYKKRN
jgi:type IV secretion system protein VirB3